MSELIARRHDAHAFAPVSSLTVGAFREWLLSPEADGPALAALSPGLTPEMVAAVSKVCRLQDLVAVAAKRPVVTRFRSTLGCPGGSRPATSRTIRPIPRRASSSRPSTGC